MKHESTETFVCDNKTKIKAVEERQIGNIRKVPKVYRMIV